VGFRTALVPRPLEHGPGGKVDEGPEPFIDMVARDFHDLASHLGL
jgi:2-haloacid dehalogenase